MGLAGQKASAYTVYFNLDDGVSNVFDNKEGSSWDYYWSYLQYGNPLIANADETVNLRIECKRDYSISSVEVDGAALSGSVVDGEYYVSFTMHAYDMTVSVATSVSLPIDEAHFPDANFRDYLLAQSYGSDGVLTAATCPYPMLSTHQLVSG